MDPIKKFNTISDNEALAAFKAAKRYPLSGYIAHQPYGGDAVMALEHQWRNTFKVNHAVAVNSGTSGLLAACMAAEIGPGCEVIVSPYTMSATAAAPKLLGADLVWADIDLKTFTLDVDIVKTKLTPRTRAIIVTNLFGCPARLRDLRKICDLSGILLIEDNAQAIFATENAILTGTIGHMGVFSLNVHKHLQVGEGGVVVTNSFTLNRKLREAMNHGEMRGGILGLNLRMPEVIAAMAIEQIKRSESIMLSRMEFAYELGYQVLKAGLPVTGPYVRDDTGHSFYCWAALMDKAPTKAIPGPWRPGYMRPLYHLPALERDAVFLPGVETVEGRILLMEICAIDPTKAQIIELVDKLSECWR